MLAWLTLIIVVLAGLLLAVDSSDLEALPPLWVAVAVVAALMALYGIIANSRTNDGRGSALRRTALMLTAVAVVAGLKWFNLLPSPWQAVPPETNNAEGAYSTSGPAAVRLRRRPDGTFLARGSLNGIATDFVIDTGAATVTLRQSDAEKAGIDVGRLAFDTPIETANGTAYAAPIRLRVVAIGALRVDDIDALVAKPGSLNESLLGINFLRRLASYELSGDFLTLRQ